MAGELPEQEDDPDFEPPPKRWSKATQSVAAVAWSSFLAAAFGTMIFFAFIDPGLLHHAATPPVEMTRMTGYGVGFFFFWLVGAIAGGVAVYLVRTAHADDADRDTPP